jgi:hypothetical protein
MAFTNRNLCPACNRPLSLLASVRLEFRLQSGATVVDEIETDALRCTHRPCRYAFLDLAELIATARNMRCSEPRAHTASA